MTLVQAIGRRVAGSMTTRRWLAVLVVALVVCGALVWLYARGGGPLPSALGALEIGRQDPLARSDADEVVLRTARLAGFSHAAVGSSAGSVLLRLDIPVVSTGADFEIAWQTGFAALARAYPRADEYVVQCFEGATGVLEVACDGPAARDALDADDPRALRAASAFALLGEADGSDEGSSAGEGVVDPDDAGMWDFIRAGMTGTPIRASVEVPSVLGDAGRALVAARPRGAREMPGAALAIDDGVAGAYLDTKNAAAGLGGEPHAGLVAECAAMRDAVGGIPAPEPGQAAAGYARRILAALEGRASGEDEVRAEIEALGAIGEELPASRVLALRTLACAAEALGADEPYGSVLALTATRAGDVADAALVVEGGREAVLADARDERANEAARDSAGFERIAADDIAADSLVAGAADSSVKALFSDPGRPVVWRDADGVPVTLVPQALSAVRRDDGTRFWIGADAPAYAIRDASIRGWAFVTPLVAVVEATDVGQWLAVFPVQVAP